MSRKGKHSPRSSVLGVVLKRTDKARLQMLADASNVSLSVYVRLVLCDAIKRGDVFEKSEFGTIRKPIDAGLHLCIPPQYVDLVQERAAARKLAIGDYVGTRASEDTKLTAKAYAAKRVRRALRVL